MNEPTSTELIAALQHLPRSPELLANTFRLCRALEEHREHRREYPQIARFICNDAPCGWVYGLTCDQCIVCFNTIEPVSRNHLHQYELGLVLKEYINLYTPEEITEALL